MSYFKEYAVYLNAGRIGQPEPSLPNSLMARGSCSREPSEHLDDAELARRLQEQQDEEYARRLQVYHQSYQ